MQVLLPEKKMTENIIKTIPGDEQCPQETFISISPFPKELRTIL
eukprot:UN27448